jgi:hypothetical protein
MKHKPIGLILLALGLVLILAAGLVKWVILPAQAQWPDDVDSTRTYEGTLHVMLNPQALQTRDLSNVFSRDVPITISRHVTTEDAEGDRAVIQEVATLHGPDGQEIQRSETWYAINRRMMEAVPKAAVADLAGGNNVLDREGLVIGFPIGTGKRNYAGWSSDYQATVEARFVREEERGGLKTYVFESSSSPRQVQDPDVLALFPADIPKEVLANLGKRLDLPALLRSQIGDAFSSLPDPVSLAYVYEYETIYWVEPTTGVLIDYNKHEAYRVALELQRLTRLVPLAPVFEQSYYMAPASVQDAAEDATRAKSLLDLYGTIFPGALFLVGLVVAAAGLLTLRR